MTVAVPSEGYVDLHSHYVPAIDDGVRTREDGAALVRGLGSIGFSMVVATPHIRTAMFENRRDPLREAHAAFASAFAQDPNDGDDPVLGLGAEHFFDDVFWDLFLNDQALPYPGGFAALVELPRDHVPRSLAQCFFQMRVRGVQPVLAHPERYRPLFKRSDELESLVDGGALPLLDVMSLTGKYGREPKKAAERMLDEGLYFAACSDAHRPTDVPTVAEGIEALIERLGRSEAETLLAVHPRQILSGDIDEP